MASHSRQLEMESSVGEMNQAAACQLLFAEQRKPFQTSEGRDSNSSILQPELDFFSDLTKQIDELQLGAESIAKILKKEATKKESLNSGTDNSSLASLYCQRAVAVLEYIDYDPSKLLPSAYFGSISSASDADNGEPEENDPETHTANDQQENKVQGVQQALNDALSAISAAPKLACGYFIAAQCMRCLGNHEKAMESVVLAHQCAPDNAGISQLLKQLTIDAENKNALAGGNATHYPSLMTSLPILSVFDTPNQEQQEQEEQNKSEARCDHGSMNNDDTDTLYQTLQVEYQSLHTLFASAWLTKLETMMHHNVHHQCTTAEEVHHLESGFRATASLFWRLLGNKIATAALGLEHDSVQEMLHTATANRPGGGFRLIAENRPLQKWITQTVAPAVRRALVPLNSLDLDSVTQDENSRKIVIVMLIRDTLLVLTRVLLAMGGWRRCTSMPHALAYAETCCDLAKELEGGEARYNAAPIMMSRLERLCTDTYATGLLKLTSEYGEALLLHQESLQAATNANDSVYEQRFHHHVGKALLCMQEFEIAKAEFTELLTLSQELGDTEMECLTQYELGEYCVQRGNLPQVQVHFKLALKLCNQAAHMGNTWRPQPVQRAITFYAAMKPTRRGAIRIAPPVSRSAHRRATQFCGSQTAAAVSTASNGDADSACAVTPTNNAPKARRPTIRVEPPPLTNAQLESEGKSSFLQSLFLGKSANSNAVDGINNSSNNDRSVASIGKTAASKLFPTASASAPQQKIAPTELAVRKPRRAAMSRRESVFTTAVPFSTTLPVATSASLPAAFP